VCVCVCVCVSGSPGDVEVQAQVWDMQGRGLNDSTVGVLASTQGPRGPGGSDGWQAAVLLYNSNDSSSTANTTTTDHTTLTVKGLAAQKGSFEETLCLCFLDLLTLLMCVFEYHYHTTLVPCFYAQYSIVIVVMYYYHVSCVLELK